MITPTTVWLTASKHAYREEQRHEEGVGEREPVDALVRVVVQVNVPARSVGDLALLELHTVGVDDLVRSVHGLAVSEERESYCVAQLGASDQLVVVLRVVNAGRSDTNANDGELVRILMVVDGKGELKWRQWNKNTWL